MNNTASPIVCQLSWTALAALWNMSEAEARREARHLASDEMNRPDALDHELLPLMAILEARWSAHHARMTDRLAG